MAETKANGAYFHRIHALDIRNGSAKPGSGVVVQTSVRGTGDPGDRAGNVLFDSLRAHHRAALLLSSNLIYVAFASHCDVGPYHGWMLAYDAESLALVTTFNTTPDGQAAGIWQSGAGPAPDAAGNVYVTIGNGSFDAHVGGSNFGNSFLKLDGRMLTVSDYFTPHD